MTLLSQFLNKVSRRALEIQYIDTFESDLSPKTKLVKLSIYCVY